MINIVTKILATFFIGAPFVGFCLAIWKVVSGKARATDIGLAILYFFLGGFGITIGFHRYATHDAFKTSWPVKAILLILGSMSWQGSVISWVATHRKHHKYSDEAGDPHSPHFGYPKTRLGLARGLTKAQFGWLFQPGDANPKEFAPKLLEDPLVVWISRLFVVWSILSILIPVKIQGVKDGIVWALAATFVRHHVTWAVNSLCHVFGYRTYSTDDESTNFWLVGLLGLGEGWHNNHHAFPRSAFHGLSWWEVDLSGYVVRALEHFNLVWDVQRPTQDMMKRKRFALLTSKE